MVVKEKEKNLIWKLRYYLKSNKEFFCGFLYSVNCVRTKELEEAIKLMSSWDGIEYYDALHLVSNYYSANPLY